jgi:quinol-cytochrome oxidoreductase complex cytochrome b subunit
MVFGVDLLSAKVVGILLAAGIFLVALLMPIIDRGKEVRALRRPLKTAVGVWAIGFLATLTLYALNEILSADLTIPIDTMNLILGFIVIVIPVMAAAPAYLILRRHLAKQTP